MSIILLYKHSIFLSSFFTIPHNLISFTFSLSFILISFHLLSFILSFTLFFSFHLTFFLSYILSCYLSFFLSSFHLNIFISLNRSYCDRRYGITQARKPCTRCKYLSFLQFVRSDDLTILSTQFSSSNNTNAHDDVYVNVNILKVYLERTYSVYVHVFVRSCVHAQ